MLGFILGIYAGVNRLKLNVTVLNVTLVAIPFLIVVANVVFRISAFNMILLFGFALAISLRLTMPGLWLGGLGFLVPLEACLLEIYLIHKYLFIEPTGNRVVDFIITLIVIVIAALVLKRAGDHLVACVFKKTPAKRIAVVIENNDEHLKTSA